MLLLSNMGGNVSKQEEFKFGSYQYGTRPGYHVTSEKWHRRVLKRYPKDFTKLRAGWAKTDTKLFYKGKHLKGTKTHLNFLLVTSLTISSRKIIRTELKVNFIELYTIVHKHLLSVYLFHLLFL